MAKADKAFFGMEAFCDVCTDGAPAMPASKSGFEMLVQKKTPDLHTTNCFIHREALISKTLTEGLECDFDLAIKFVNYFNSSTLNSRLFLQLCKSLNSDDKYFLKIIGEDMEIVNLAPNWQSSIRAKGA